jgi:hypothetical protein
MGDVVNLNKFRKAKSKDKKEKKAGENRRKFGLTKAEKTAEQKIRTQTLSDLDGKKLDETPSDD